MTPKRRSVFSFIFIINCISKIYLIKINFFLLFRDLDFLSVLLNSDGITSSTRMHTQILIKENSFLLILENLNFSQRDELLL